MKVLIALFCRPLFCRSLFCRSVFCRSVFCRSVFCRPVFCRPVFSLLMLATLWLGGLTLSASNAFADRRPNILWISVEDISSNLGCYGDPHAVTPNLDRLASEGVRFTRAFTPAGVCAVVRSGIITGLYPPAIGSQHMRSRIIPPSDVRAFPERLRAAGYFTTNRSKTDYQFDPTDSIWDLQGDGHNDWRDRPDPDQPFFSVINFTQCHESQIRHSDAQHRKVIQQIGAENQHDPAVVADTIPAFLPRTPATQKDWARYQDNITLVDQLAGEVLDRLQEDGLADNTLVVFWSDHGMGLPRGKRWIYDTGTLVPVIMRWPDRMGAGEVRSDLISVLDLPPTMLKVAGVPVPRNMHGRLIVDDQGDEASDEPPYLFFHRDRMDEVYELQRAARDRRWKYIRNFEPDKPYSQRLDYMDEMPTMQDWRRLHAAGELTGGQKNWFAETKPIEELYDTENDPWELTNLALRPQYAERLARMRQATERWQRQIADTGMIPESVLMEEMKPGGVTPKTDPPSIRRDGKQVSIQSSGDGVSIVYQVFDNGKWSDWKLYSRSFPSDGRVRCKATRLGYRDSDIVDLKI
ncbi:Arylsulfatase [Rubripirellula lacrimiformis]|uniref:Arylsulfatase n=1 Tax=Rubripirellula lacrimiformis TaxID=1930273 RepID=A0A517NIA8_9BACT|nr:sulfatase-like hydrolase/transferase [Rubripirellula lacrimiformis]QDT06818.1 Arylsulfatase [Rubripirellula lacrimiformis]